MELLLIFFGWIIFSHVIAEVLPELVRGIGYLIGFLLLCLWEVLKFAFRAALWLLRHGAIAIVWAVRVAARGLHLGFLFLFYFADEWRRGPQDEAGAPDEEFSGAAPDDDGTSPADAYAQALALLGLTPGFTRAALKRAYRAAIRKAHPDAGGSAQAAQAVNAAYELILHAHGWAR